MFMTEEAALRRSPLSLSLSIGTLVVIVEYWRLDKSTAFLSLLLAHKSTVPKHDA